MQQHDRTMVEIVQVSLSVDRLLILICIIPKVNLGAGEMCFMFCDL